MKRKDNGSALVLTLIITLVAFTLGISLLLSSQVSGRIAARRVNSELAFRIAEAGVQHALVSLRENSNYLGETNTPFGAGTMTITVNTPAAFPLHRQVTSRSVVNYAEGLSVTRQLNALVDLTAPPVVGQYSVVSKGPLTFKGNSSVGSFPKGGVGNIGSNTNVALIGSVSISGSATSTGTVKTIGAAHVNGSVYQNVSPIPFPTLDLTNIKAEAAANGTFGSTTLNSGGTVVLSGLINGDLTIGSNTHVIIKSPIYVTGKVSLGDATIDAGLILSEGDMSGKGTIQNNDNGLTFVTESNFSLQAGGSVSASIVAPNGDVSLGGHASVFGTIASDTVSMAGTPTITRNTAFNWPPEFLPVHLGYYKE
jgi:Tfp pilus assembly protein PilX